MNNIKINKPKKIYCKTCKHLGSVTICKDYPTRRICSNDSFCKLGKLDTYDANRLNDCTKYERKRFANFWETIWTYLYFAAAIMNFIAYGVYKDKFYLIFGVVFLVIYFGRLINDYMEQRYES